MPGHLLKSTHTVQLVINYSSKIIISPVGVLSQVKFAKGGMLMYIYRAWITTKDGEKIYAKNYGKRAFRIWIGPGPEPVKVN